MKIYVVEYYDYDDTEIKGVFTDSDTAEKCYVYESMCVDITNVEDGTYGRGVTLSTYDTSDDVDFDSKIAELKEYERRKQQEKDDAIKESDLKEYNRIKEKYGL